jgi:hypothetical protein
MKRAGVRKTVNRIALAVILMIVFSPLIIMMTGTP